MKSRATAATAVFGAAFLAFAGVGLWALVRHVQESHRRAELTPSGVPYPIRGINHPGL